MIELADIEEVPLEEQTLYGVKAMSQGGHSLALAEIASFKTKSIKDYRKIVNGLKICAQTPRGQFVKTPRVSADANGRPIYELKAQRGHARLFFFYATEGDDEVVIVTSGFWKTGSNKKETKDQSRQFDLAADLMLRFQRERKK